MTNTSKKLLAYSILNNYVNKIIRRVSVDVPGRNWRDSEVPILKHLGDICDKHSMCQDCELFTTHIRDFCYIRLVLRC